MHSRQIVEVLRQFAAYPKHLCDEDVLYKASLLWDETKCTSDKLIKAQTQFVTDPGSVILSGPHISEANPLYKTPRAVCEANSHYDPLDLTELPEDYLSRTNFTPLAPKEVYESHIPRVPWLDQRRITDFYRVAVRKRLNLSRERSLLAAIIPPKVAHIYACLGVAFCDGEQMISMAAALASLPFDLFVKTTGRPDFLDEQARVLPLLRASSRLSVRVLLLNCLTSYYARLWRGSWNAAFTDDRWSKQDARLNDCRFSRLAPEWSWQTPLRADYERRQALIEIDVLVSRELGLRLDDLRTLYRIQFPVLRHNEEDTWYDHRGRIVFTSSKGLPGVGFSRPEWERIRHMTSGTVTRTIQDDTVPGGPRERVIEYVAPFDRCDREADYATAWKFFDEAGV